MEHGLEMTINFPPTLTLTLVGAMLVLSAVLCGAETAMLSASKARLHQLARRIPGLPPTQTQRRAQVALSLLRRTDDLLAAIVLCANAINIVSSTLTTAVMVQLFGPVGVAYATGVMAVVILILVEALPKAMGARFAEPMTLLFARPLSLLMLVTRPLTWLIGHFTHAVLALLGARGHSHTNFTDADLRGALSMALQHRVIGQERHHMLSSILDLDDLTVADAMVHRSALQALDLATPAATLPATLAALNHSRVPVWSGRPDNLVGLLNVRDFFSAMAATPESIPALKKLLRPLTFVPETTPLGHQLREFLRQNVHLALVVDEYGDVEGLISLEDILEEIVGDIRDERESLISVPEKGAELAGDMKGTQHGSARGLAEDSAGEDGSRTLPGKLPLRDANRRYGWELPESETAVTLAGLLTENHGRLPAQGETINVAGFSFNVVARRGHRLEKIRVTPPAPVTDRLDEDLPL